MGAEQSTPTTTPSAPDESENIIPAPAVAPIVEKDDLPPPAEKMITVSLSDVNVSESKSLGKRHGERPTIGTNTPSDEEALSQATTRSSVPLSFRFSKNRRKERIGISLHSGEDCEGVVITGLQDGVIRGVGAQPGDRVVSINGVPVKTATQAGEVLKQVVGDCEVVVERADNAMEA